MMKIAIIAITAWTPTVKDTPLNVMQLMLFHGLMSVSGNGVENGNGEKRRIKMPCNGGNYFGRDRTVYRESPESRMTIDLLTRRLCFSCEQMEKNGVEISPELDEWWYEHKLRDKALQKEAELRANKETATDRRDRYLAATKERVIGQLTSDEKEALGIEEE